MEAKWRQRSTVRTTGKLSPSISNDGPATVHRVFSWTNGRRLLLLSHGSRSVQITCRWRLTGKRRHTVRLLLLLFLNGIRSALKLHFCKAAAAQINSCFIIIVIKEIKLSLKQEREKLLSTLRFFFYRVVNEEEEEKNIYGSWAEDWLRRVYAFRRRHQQWRLLAAVAAVLQL
jgi:hypothetical protein